MNENSLAYKLCRLLGILAIATAFLGPMVIYFTGVKWWKFVIEIIIVVLLYYPYNYLDMKIKKQNR